MIDVTLATVIIFLLSLVISAIIIYFVTRLFGEKKEGFGTALLTAFIGSIIYAAAYYFLKPELGWLASLIGGIAWLIVLGSLYGIGWLKAIGIAFIVWIIAAIVGIFLPTMMGPL
jgi:Na+/melibiose symporter-like transporter